MGTVQQDSDAQFVGLSVGEDIAFSLENNATPRDIMLEKVNLAAKTVDMSDFLLNVPFNLSGGQKQRLSIARALLKNSNTSLSFESAVFAICTPFSSV